MQFGGGQMPYSKSLVHLVWSTKKREKIITQEIKELLLNHILENAKKIFIIRVNCTIDHIHLLIS